MPAETASTPSSRGQTQAHAIERAVSDLASRQFGVVSRAQLRQIGLEEGAIDRRLRTGRLHHLHPGVYAVGHRWVPTEGRWVAAVMRGGSGAVLSHGSAAELWELLAVNQGARVEIAIPRATRSCSSIHRHFMRIPSDEVTERRGIAVTTISRTLMDLASSRSIRTLERAVREAEYAYRYDAQDLVAMLRRHPGQRGTRAIRRCLASIGLGPAGRTRSGLEVRFAAILARSDLPQPELNVVLDLGGRVIEADCLWRRERVIVELDGGRAHGTRAAFESDRERDRRLHAAGWRVLRITWRQLEAPSTVLEDLAQVLSIGELASTPGSRR